MFSPLIRRWRETHPPSPRRSRRQVQQLRDKAAAVADLDDDTEQLLNEEYIQEAS